jgi:outer membrane protein assembly factor BamD
MKIQFIFVITIFSFLIGCSSLGVDKDSKKIIADGLTPKELYDKAEDKLNAGSVDQAIEQYEEILVFYPSSKYAIQARLDIAFNLVKQKKFKRAILELEEFIKKYPDIAPTPYAYYLRAVAAEKQSSSILDEIITDKAQRDVESVKDAYKYYVELIEKFPESKYAKEAQEKLVILVNTLARHEFYVALYYTRIGGHIAAINRVKFIIENYPNSSLVPDSLHLMALNYKKINADDLAENVTEVLKLNFPNYAPNYSI